MNSELKALIFALLNSALLISEGSTVDSIDDDDLLETFKQYCMTLMYSPTITEAVKTQLQKINKLIIAESTLKMPLVEALLKKETIKITEGNNDSKDKGTDDLLNKANIILSRSILITKLAESKLPQIIKDKISKQFDGKVFKESELTEALKDEQDILAKLNPALVDNGGADSIQLGQTAIDKIEKQLHFMMLSDFAKTKLTEAEKKVFKDAGVDEHFYSIREIYSLLTGDKSISGLKKPGQKGLLSEALVTSDLATIFANVLNKAMLADYRFSAYNQDWRKIVSQISSPPDFKTNTRARLGGYANIPVVAENAIYTDASSPDDYKVEFAIRKRGFLETITREMIINDDLGAIRKIPQRMGQSAARTVYEFVFDLIIANPALDYDSKALFHADHSNIEAAILSATSYNDARIKMFNQTEDGSSKKIGIQPRFLLVPVELEKIAYELVTPAYNMKNQVPEFFQTWQIEPIIVAHASDATKWYLLADPLQSNTIEIGFLQGRQEPEILVSDMPTQGSYFTYDQIKYKIRHEYDGDLLDHRSFVGGNV